MVYSLSVKHGQLLNLPLLDKAGCLFKVRFLHILLEFLKRICCFGSPKTIQRLNHNDEFFTCKIIFTNEMLLVSKF